MTRHSAHRDRQTRALILATAVDAAGSGLQLTALPLFLVHVRHVSAGQVGLALGIAGGASLLGGLVLGSLADLMGIRRVLLAGMLLQTPVIAWLPFTTSWPVFVLLLALAGFFAQGARSARYAAIAALGGPEKVSLRARLRVMSNLGLGLGTGVAALAAAADTAAAYTCAILANAVSCTIAALILRFMPTLTAAAMPPTHATAPRRGGQWAGLTVALPRMTRDPRRGPRHASRASAGRGPMRLADRGYLAVTALNGVLFLETRVLMVGIPLWVATNSSIPRWTAAACLLVNTAIVIGCQVRVTRDVTTPHDAARSWLRSGVAFQLSAVLIAVSSGAEGSPAAVVMLAAAAVHSLGELWHMAGSFELALDLAPQQAQGRHQGVFLMGEGVATLCGPMVVATLCIGAGPVGWIIMGAVLAASAVAGYPTIHWAAARAVPW